ncbi:MAG TPA: YhjD/YihY/BrkB family envelope integrity protein, partial [Gudongella oleilytica]|nr:YhjD/YihY/BrkB family envelope integrity protein [Gudongella oleilytica]
LLLSYYVSNFGKYAITYGSLGGVIVLLIWMYYSSIVIVLGGEINATLEDMRKNGLKVNPEKSAFYED